MATTMLLGRIGRGFVVGAVGTASMTACQEISAKLRSDQEGVGAAGAVVG